MKTTCDTLIKVEENALQIVEFAKSLLGTRYSYQNFNCSHFVQLVYGKFDIPMMQEVCFETITDFNDPSAIGKLILLVHSKYRSKHTAIYIGNHQVIHNSFYFGRKVVITSLEDLLKVYEQLMN